MDIHIPRVAAIHDLPGFGRAALAVVIPILSTMGIQVCPLPTAVFSTHGAFPNYISADLTNFLRDCLAHWHALDIRFDSVYSGFLGSTRQIDVITKFLRERSKEKPLIVIDPVLGDHGKIYGVTGKDMVEGMRQYIRIADIITPNLTEAALLLEKPYNQAIQEDELKEWLIQLSECGPGTVIITSAPVRHSPHEAAVISYNRREKRFLIICYEVIPVNFPGTGDIFTSVLIGSLLQEHSLLTAIERAVQFTASAIRTAYQQATPPREGVLLEGVLDALKGSMDHLRNNVAT